LVPRIQREREREREQQRCDQRRKAYSPLAASGDDGEPRGLTADGRRVSG
jgi:hypothetical protein